MRLLGKPHVDALGQGMAMPNLTRVGMYFEYWKDRERVTDSEIQHAQEWKTKPESHREALLRGKYKDLGLYK